MATPLLLVTTAHTSLDQHPAPDGGRHPHFGRLLQPRHTSSCELSAAEGVPWAADNDCFNGLVEAKYLAMLERFGNMADKGELGDCKFVTIPDVVRCTNCDRTVDGYGDKHECRCGKKPRFVYGDAELTLQRFEEWQPLVADLGLPIGLVLQDGADETGVPWDAIDALFIGGSTEYKLSESAAEYARMAKMLGKWVHWGRVNTGKRIDHVWGTGACDSFDGSKWARWRKTYLDGGLTKCAELAAAPVALHEGRLPA